MAKAGDGKCIRWLREHVNYVGADCLIWPFHRNSQKGYGDLGYNGRQLYAHRLMCELVHGPAPADRPQAAHSCGNGHLGCVNPLHLSWKSNSENQLDRQTHGTREPTNTGWGRTKLTVAQIQEIRALRGIETQVNLAKRFGVKPGCIEYWHKRDRPPAPPGSSVSSIWRRKKLKMRAST